MTEMFQVSYICVFYFISTVRCESCGFQNITCTRACNLQLYTTVREITDVYLPYQLPKQNLLFELCLNWEDVVVGHKVTPTCVYLLATVYQNWNINEATMSTKSANDMHKKCKTVNNTNDSECRMIPI